MLTIVETLRNNARLTERAITFVRANGDEGVVSFPEVFKRACQRAEALLALGLQRGDRVALVLPDPEDFVLTFLGLLVGGFVAVPVYPPATLAKMDAYGETVRHVLEASGAKLLVTSDALLPMLRKELPSACTEPMATGLRLLSEREIRGAHLQGEDRFAVSPDNLAFLQFTSGSTSRPKGVLVTHGSLAANGHGIMFDGLRAREGDRGVCWLPLYHDMGLIGFVVAPLFAQVEVMFLPTASFVRRPSLWLDAIHRFRGTITFGPNFAYALATRSVQDRQTKDWDLSCLRVLGCGAEPIQASVLTAFVERFAPQGLRADALLPCYGMAEATLAITFHELGTPVRTDRVAVDALRRGKATPVVGDGPALELVGCGKPFPGHEIAIIAPDGAPLVERTVGEIVFRGPSVTRGYYADEASTAACFDTRVEGKGAGWLRTGDLGYVVDGELFVCGREKDLLILNGRNYFPDDIERVTAAIHGVREGSCVAFAALDASGKERAIIVAEGRSDSADPLESAIIQAVRSEVGLVVDEVVLIKRGTLPKTSSGKVRRKETKRRFEEGELELSPLATSSAPPAAPPSAAEISPKSARKHSSSARSRTRHAQPEPELSMGSNRADVEVSYDVSNEFFRLWLDERMNYTSAVYETMEQTGPMAPSEEGVSLEKAQQNKLHILSEMARVTPDKAVLDIGCGWGSCLEYLSGVRNVKRAVGVTLSTEQAREVNERKIPRVECVGSDFMKWETDETFDAVVSICMIDHLCSPQEAREGKAVGIYREYFKRVHKLTKPGSQFALQAILRNRTPRIKKDLEDVFFTTKIFPGGLNPRLEDLVMAVNPYWEIITVHTRRQHYQRTTLEWLRRMRAHEASIRKQWGDQVFDDYDRYLSTCVRAFEMHYSSLAQLELRRIDLTMTAPKADILAQFKSIATRINHKSFEHVTRDSVITELGIDSLSTMQIVGELETEFDIMIPDEDLVEMVTVGDLCKKIETRLLRRL